MRGARSANRTASGKIPRLKQSGSRFRLRVGDDRTVEVTPGSFTIGRSGECALQLNGGLVSRKHAQIECTEAGLTIADLGSRNGVVVNQRRITEPTPLAHGDTIASEPDLVRRFLKATLRGYEEATRDPGAAVDAFMKANPTAERPLLEKQLAASLAMMHSPASQGRPVGWTAESDWTATLNRLEQDLGMTGRKPTAAYFTNDLQ